MSCHAYFKPTRDGNWECAVGGFDSAPFAVADETMGGKLMSSLRDLLSKLSSSILYCYFQLCSFSLLCMNHRAVSFLFSLIYQA